MIFILQLSPKDLVIMMRDSMTTRSTRITRTTAPDSCLESGQHMPSPSLQDPTWHTWSLGSCCHATCPLLGTCLERDKSQPEPSSDAVRENKPCFSSAMGRFLPAFEISRIKNHHRYSENWKRWLTGNVKTFEISRNLKTLKMFRHKHLKN